MSFHAALIFHPSPDNGGVEGGRAYLGVLIACNSAGSILMGAVEAFHILFQRCFWLRQKLLLVLKKWNRSMINIWEWKCHMLILTAETPPSFHVVHLVFLSTLILWWQKIDPVFYSKVIFFFIVLNPSQRRSKEKCRRVYKGEDVRFCWVFEAQITLVFNPVVETSLQYVLGCAVTCWTGRKWKV